MLTKILDKLNELKQDANDARAAQLLELTPIPSTTYHEVAEVLVIDGNTYTSWAHQVAATRRIPDGKHILYIREVS